MHLLYYATDLASSLPFCLPEPLGGRKTGDCETDSGGGAGCVFSWTCSGLGGVLVLLPG